MVCVVAQQERFTAVVKHSGVEDLLFLPYHGDTAVQMLHENNLNQAHEPVADREIVI